MNIQLVLPDNICNNWHLYKPLIERALSHSVGESSIADHLRKLMNYESHLWVVKDQEELKGIVLTQFLDYAQHRTLHIIALSGSDFKDWVHLYSTIEEFAKQNKSVAIEMWGRDGWEKVLPKTIPGFEKVYVVMRKELQE